MKIPRKRGEEGEHASRMDRERVEGGGGRLRPVTAYFKAATCAPTLQTRAHHITSALSHIYIKRRSPSTHLASLYRRKRNAGAPTRYKVFQTQFANRSPILRSTSRGTAAVSLISPVAHTPKDARLSDSSLSSLSLDFEALSQNEDEQQLREFLDALPRDWHRRWVGELSGLWRRGSRQKSGESAGVVQNIAETQLSGEHRIGCNTPRTPHDPEVSAVALPASAIRSIGSTRSDENLDATGRQSVSLRR